MNIWQTMEMIHSRSYTHIIKNVYADPSEVFDKILEDDKILSRAQSVTRAYDEFLQAAQVYGSGNMWEHQLDGVPLAQNELYELKRKLYRAVANVYILEELDFTSRLLALSHSGNLNFWKEVLKLSDSSQETNHNT